MYERRTVVLVTLIGLLYMPICLANANGARRGRFIRRRVLVSGTHRALYCLYLFHVCTRRERKITMLQDHYADMLTDTDSRLLPGRPVPQARSKRVLRHGASGVGLMLLLTLLENIIWLAS